jgi:hypothetical protein
VSNLAVCGVELVVELRDLLQTGLDLRGSRRGRRELVQLYQLGLHDKKNRISIKLIINSQKAAPTMAISLLLRYSLSALSRSSSLSLSFNA